jgi:hypothetical protein
MALASQMIAAQAATDGSAYYEYIGTDFYAQTAIFQPVLFAHLQGGNFVVMNHSTHATRGLNADGHGYDQYANDRPARTDNLALERYTAHVVDVTLYRESIKFKKGLAFKNGE